MQLPFLFPLLQRKFEPLGCAGKLREMLDSWIITETREMSFPMTTSPATTVPLTTILPRSLSRKHMGHFVTAPALLGQSFQMLPKKRDSWEGYQDEAPSQPRSA